MRRRLGLVAALAMVLVTCGGADVAEVTTTTSTTLATTTTTSTSTTSTSTTTTTTSTTTTTTSTTTTTVPPPPVVGWEGDGLDEVTVDYLGPNGDLGVSVPIGSLTAAMDLTRTEGAAVHLEVDVEIAAGAIEHDGEPCYAGATVQGTVSLVDTTGVNPTLTAPIDGHHRPPMVLLSCDRRKPESAPFRYAMEPDLVAAAVDWWEEGSVPYLAWLLRADHYVFAARLEAIQAARLMEWDEISEAHQYELLHDALWFARRISHMSNDVDDARVYRRAVESLFDEALEWEIEIPVTGDATADSFDILAIMRLLDVRY